MINLDALVLRAGQTVFGEPITIYPKVSAPDIECFKVRGVYTSKPITVALQEGVFQTWEHQISVRLSELKFKPMQCDEVEHKTILYSVANVETDGQGAAILTLKKVE